MKSLLLTISFAIFFISGCANPNNAPKKKREYGKDYILCLNKDKSLSLKKGIEIFRVKPKSYPFKKEFFNCNINYKDVEFKVRSGAMGESFQPIKIDKSNKCESFIEVYEDKSVIYKIVEFDKLKETKKEGILCEIPTFREYETLNPILFDEKSSCTTLKEARN